VEPVTVEVGRRIARRYRLDERLVDTDGVQTWRAFDEVLARPVGAHVISTGHPRAQAVVSAAQAAARELDERFLRVLDAAEDHDLIYVIQEWVTGRNLSAVLVDDGPLDPPVVQSLITEVAAAIAGAHVSGLAHLMLSPDSIIFGPGGETKITGLAVEAALHGVSVGDPAATDTRALGALLFATLTARWPEHAGYGLPGVARDGTGRDEDRLPTPRQVRAGVPASLDAIVDRTLNNPPRHHQTPLTSPAEFVSALRALPKPVLRQPTMSIPLVPVRPNSPDTQVHQRHVQPTEAGDWGPSRGMRAVRILVTVLVVSALFLLGALLAKTAIDHAGQGNDGATGPPSPSVPAGTALTVAQAYSFDPVDGCANCNGEEHDEEIPNLIDADPGSTWSSFSYDNPTLPPFKPGIGFVLDLGSVQSVGSVKVSLVGSGATVELRALPADASASPIPGIGAGAAGNADNYDVVVRPADVSGPTFTLSPESPVQTRYLLVWFTKLPVEGGGGRGRAVVGNVEVDG
jgi:serine/threonine protein kinase